MCAQWQSECNDNQDCRNSETEEGTPIAFCADRCDDICSEDQFCQLMDIHCILTCQQPVCVHLQHITKVDLITFLTYSGQLCSLQRIAAGALGCEKEPCPEGYVCKRLAVYCIQSPCPDSRSTCVPIGIQ